MIEVPSGHLYLGEQIDEKQRKRTGDAVLLDSSDLTTHGVIVGMTGSGKTGLGVVMLEEALLQGIPTIILDPKGDLGNLLLMFPELRPEDFAPWVEDGDPAEVAATWRTGLEGWGIEPSRIQALRDVAAFTIYTPGSTSGVPLNIVGGLRRPPEGTDAETMHDEIEGFVSGLLNMVGIESDPLSGKEHILLSNLVEQAWTAGQDLDLATLVAQVQDPPLRKLGVYELDDFFPPKDRTKLAMTLNGLLASRAFAAWSEGPDLAIDTLLGSADGSRPACSIISLSHLSDEERQFVVSLLLGKLITWMRRQAGTSKLRALVYFDEVTGFVPPNGAPPAKKPILTLLKQARAFGVGIVLATQNPVDVDYKGLSNAGTWMIGRLQTEQDKARLLDGLSSAGGEVDVKAAAEVISSLDKREFMLRESGASAPALFTTRWAMSYLRGPLTREQISTLMQGRYAPPPTTGGTTPAAATQPTDAATAAPAPDKTTPGSTPAGAGTASAASPAMGAGATATPAAEGTPDTAAAGATAASTAPGAAPDATAPTTGGATTPASTTATAASAAPGATPEATAPTTGGATTPAAAASPAAAAAAPTGTGTATAATAPPTPTGDEETVPVAPKVADGVAERWLDPAAPWIGQVPGALATSTKLAPALVARVALLFDDSKLDLRHTEEWEAVYSPLPATFDPAQAVNVDHDERDLRTEAPAGATYVLTDAPIDRKSFFTGAEKAIVDHLYRTSTQQVPYNRALKLAGRVGESADEFAARCRAAATEAADQDQVKLQKKYAARIDRAQAAVATASDRAAQAQAAEQTRKTSAMASGAGALLGAMLGGRRSARSIARDIGSALGGQGRSKEASTRTDTARNNMARKQQALADLEQELAAELVEIDQTWQEKAAAVETVDVRLKRNDIRVSAFALVWMPVA